ncbi:MAG: S-layer homology domain-containing protein [Patescibacteria group bacterium]|nr:S-layer homology domain-containing protein [Patescibacteria group bacterium]
MIKKTFWAVIVLSLIVFPVAYAEFSDLSENHPNYNAIDYVQSQGIVSGYDDGEFKPNNKINRAEFVKIVVNALFTSDEIDNCTPIKSFSDIVGDEWFAPYVCVATNNGVISGYDDGTFKPANNINFAEAAKIMVGAFDYEVGFDEIWYKPFVQELESRGAIPTSICSFDQYVSRGEVAEVIYRLMGNINDKTSTEFFTEDADLIDSITFSKKYSVKARTWGNGISTTSDGGYIVTGSTIPKCEMCDTDSYISKLTDTGAVEWTRLVQTVPGGSGGDDGYGVTELADGGYLMIGITPGFETDEELNGTCYTRIKTFFSKFDSAGNHQWSRNFPFGSDDMTDSIYPTDDGGFVYLDNLSEWETQDAGGDIYYEFPYSSLKLIKFDSNGNEEWVKRISADDDDNSSFELTSDGGFILTGNINYPDEDGNLWGYSEMEGVMKLDGNGDLEWAKSIEAIPFELPTAIMNEAGDGYTVDYLEWRMPAGQIDFVKETSDGGYIAFGFFSTVTTSGMNLPIDMEAALAQPLMAVKMDGEGNLEWAKTLVVETTSYKENLLVEQAADGGFVFVNAFTEQDDNINEKNATYEDMVMEIYDAFENGELTENEAIAAYAEIPTEYSSTSRYNSLVIKTDDEFNLQWVKQIGGDTAFYSNDAVMTEDQGVAIIASAGEFVNDAGEYMYVVKLNANGNTTADSSLVFDYEGATSSEDVTAYVQMNDIEATSLDYDLPVRNQSPFTPSYSATAWDIDFAMETSLPLCYVDSGSSSGGVSATNWAQVYYEGVVEVEPINETSWEIYNELMPILNEIYDGEVKLWDNYYGMMLDFAFGRVVTEDDIATVQEYYEGLGYKMLSNENGTLTMDKIGRTIDLDFSILQKTKGTLNVMW